VFQHQFSTTDIILFDTNKRSFRKKIPIFIIVFNHASLTMRSEINVITGIEQGYSHETACAISQVFIRRDAIKIVNVSYITMIVG
jgi:hypothetical protein